MKIRLVLAPALAALLLSSASAAEPASAAQLARILMPKSTWSQGLDQLGNAVQAQMRGHPGSQLQYPADFDAKVKAELEQVLPYEDLVAMHAKELAASYTAAELDGLVAFYSGPLGQKTLKVNPQVTENVAQATQQRVQSKMPAVMKRLAEHAKPPAGASPQGAGAEKGASLPPGHPPMGETAPAPAKKAAPDAKGAMAKPKPKAAAPAPKPEGDAAAK